MTCNADNFDSDEFKILLDKLDLLNKLIQAYPNAWYQEHGIQIIIGQPIFIPPHLKELHNIMKITEGYLGEDFSKQRGIFLKTVESYYKNRRVKAVIKENCITQLQTLLDKSKVPT